MPQDTRCTCTNNIHNKKDMSDWLLDICTWMAYILFVMVSLLMLYWGACYVYIAIKHPELLPELVGGSTDTTPMMSPPIMLPVVSPPIMVPMPMR